ncbi:MAG: hypothetical protein IPK46_09000 [Saprospiraceae bacterium]|nr:hypothetical protein [Saprospiraceae bacterium]
MKHFVILSLLAVLLLAPVFVFATTECGHRYFTPNANAIWISTAAIRVCLYQGLATNTTAASPLSGFRHIDLYTATAGDVTPGYYGCDGTKWVGWQGSGTGWSLSGNGGTNPVPTFWVQRITRICSRNNAGPAC